MAGVVDIEKPVMIVLLCLKALVGGADTLVVLVMLEIPVQSVLEMS
jgi:hypothetical protein